MLAINIWLVSDLFAEVWRARGFASRLSCLGVQSAKRASVQAKDCVNTKLRRRTSRFFEKGFTKSGWIDRIRSNWIAKPDMVELYWKVVGHRRGRDESLKAQWIGNWFARRSIKPVMRGDESLKAQWIWNWGANCVNREVILWRKGVITTFPCYGAQTKWTWSGSRKKGIRWADVMRCNWWWYVWLSI